MQLPQPEAGAQALTRFQAAGGGAGVYRGKLCTDRQGEERGGGIAKINIIYCLICLLVRNHFGQIKGNIILFLQ